MPSFYHRPCGYGLPDDQREDAALEWAQSALKITKTQDHEKMGKGEVAEVLARMPPYSKDDCWPCCAARELIRFDPYLAHRLSIAKFNLRGMVSRKPGEGGKQERELAMQYRACARKVEIDWPETATLLGGLAKTYKRDAERVDMKRDIL